jgi:hypothetical protein
MKWEVKREEKWELVDVEQQKDSAFARVCETWVKVV